MYTNHMWMGGMGSFLLFVSIAVLHGAVGDVNSDGVILPTKCEGNDNLLFAILLWIYNLKNDY